MPFRDALGPKESPPARRFNSIAANEERSGDRPFVIEVGGYRIFLFFNIQQLPALSHLYVAVEKRLFQHQVDGGTLDSGQRMAVLILEGAGQV